jgi:hypothetical protein
MSASPQAAAVLPSVSKEEKRQASLKAFDELKTHLIKRYGAAFVIYIPESNCISMHWKLKRDDSPAILSVLVSRNGKLRIEFTSNVVHGMTKEAVPTEGDVCPTILVDIKPDCSIKVLHQEEFAMMHGFWNAAAPPKGNYSTHTQGFLFDFINALLSA